MPKIPPLESPIKLRRCSRCKTTKPITEFYVSRKRPDGMATQCKGCTKYYAREWVKENMQKVLLKNKKWRHKKIHSGSIRYFVMHKLCASRVVAKRRGYVPCSSTVDELILLYTQTCQLCGTFVGRRIHMDHCHTTGKFRGFICGGCNTVIGHSKESIEVLEKVIEYLRSRKI